MNKSESKNEEKLKDTNGKFLPTGKNTILVASVNKESTSISKIVKISSQIF